MLTKIESDITNQSGILEAINNYVGLAADISSQLI